MSRQIKIHPIGSNQTEVHIGANRFLVSYKTPVAAYISGQGFFRTSQKWSVTTSKHINKWLDCAVVQTVPQHVIEEWFSI